jgi:excisionase family DNA binding protein
MNNAETSVMGSAAIPQPSNTQGQQPAFEPLLDDEQAAALLGGIHRTTLQRMARAGTIPAYRVGRFWRYRATELNDWLALQCARRIARVN